MEPIKFLNSAKKICFLAVLTFAPACSSISHRNEANQVTPGTQIPADPTQQKLDSLASSLSKAQGRIEELEAKLAAMKDTVDNTKTAVENITGSKDINAVGVGENADGVPHLDLPSLKQTGAKALPLRSNENVTTSTGVPQDESVAAFTKAMNLYRRGEFPDSVLAFNHYVEMFPDQVLAGTAQYHAAESYFMMGELKLALPEYKKVVSSFSTSPRVPSALVRISQIHQALGQSNDAQKILTYVKANYPQHPALDLKAPAPKKMTTLKATTQGAPLLESSPIEPGKATDPKTENLGNGGKEPLDQTPLSDKKDGKVDNDKDSAPE